MVLSFLFLLFSWQTSQLYRFICFIDCCIYYKQCSLKGQIFLNCYGIYIIIYRGMQGFMNIISHYQYF